MSRKILGIGFLAALMVFGTAVWAVSFYPVDGNGAYAVTVMRHFDTVGNFTTTFVKTGPYGTEATQPIDASLQPYQWDIGKADPLATDGLRFTLSQSYDFKEFYTYYNQSTYTPISYQIKVSNTGFGSMTTVVGPKAAALTNTDSLTTPVTGRYIEYTWTGSQGTPTSGYVLLGEFQAFANAGGSSPVLTYKDGLNLTALTLTPTPISATDLTPGKWTDPVGAAIDLNTQSYLRGNNTGDAKFTVDLQQVFPLAAISMGFYPGQTWGNGAMIEISADNTNWTTVFNTTSAVGDTNIALLNSFGRYIRITDKAGTGNTGAMTEIEFFAPEPAAGVLLAAGLLALARRRRR